MQKLFIANWKSNKTTSQAEQFIREFVDALDLGNLSDTTVILCPPFTLLSFVSQFIRANDLSLHIGAQNVSPFPTGAYTGELAAELVHEFCEYVIIGHSERRTNFGENDALLFKKVEQARAEGLKTIYCVQNELTEVPKPVDYIAYEPPSAIGTGNPDDPEKIGEVFDHLKIKYDESGLLYGGSVSAENVTTFTTIPNISGLLVGGASLSAASFASIISAWK